MLRTLLTEWSRLLLGSFADAGVRDVVICPGARSAPFALAAARCPKLRCQVVTDERAAGFLALGMARVTGMPTLLLCTSGSAPTHFYPAIAEAAAAGIPLIALTADRPPELHDCGAPQTMDQLKLFGSQVRRFVELGEPNDAELSLRALRRSAAQAVFTSRYPVPGPVQLNVRARKPLEPLEPSTDEEHALAARVASIASAPLVSAELPAVHAPASALQRAANALAHNARGLIVVGPLTPRAPALYEALFALAERVGYPIFAEATSQLRFHASPAQRALLCGGFDRLLAVPEFCEQHTPELVLQLGATPTSSRWERYANSLADCELIVLGEHAWRDPASRATQQLFGELEHSVSELYARVEGLALRRPSVRRAYRESVAQAERAAQSAAERLLRERPGLCEGQVVRTVSELAPLGSSLFVGNSLPLRHLDGFTVANDSRLRVLFQRGLNGIDGCVAGSIGGAQASEHATTVLLGDLTLQHDLGSLALLGEARHPFVVVVTQNAGGRIFEQLPFAERLSARESELVFARPLASFEAAAALHGGHYERVESSRALELALRRAYARPGLTLVEALVPPHGAQQDERFIAEQLRAALALRRAS